MRDHQALLSISISWFALLIISISLKIFTSLNLRLACGESKNGIKGKRSVKPIIIARIICFFLNNNLYLKPKVSPITNKGAIIRAVLKVYIDKTKITLDTQTIILFADGGPGVDPDLVVKALKRGADYIVKFCDGKVGEIKLIQ